MAEQMENKPQSQSERREPDSHSPSDRNAEKEVAYLKADISNYKPQPKGRRSQKEIERERERESAKEGKMVGSSNETEVNEMALNGSQINCGEIKNAYARRESGEVERIGIGVFQRT